MKIFKYLAPVVTISMALAMGTANAKDYKMLSSWDSSYAYNPYLVEPFVEGIKEASDGRYNITVFGPETVSPFEQMEPVGSGVFDFLFTHGAYHFGTSPLMTAADALEGDLSKMRESGVFDYLDKHYQQFGLKLIMLPITPEGAYHIISRKPVTADGDLSGMKVRGTLSYKGVVDFLNGSLTVIPASEVYTALEKGVVDAAAWPIIGALDYRWNEVANNLIRPGFGVNYEPIFMNLDAWNSLSAEDQQMFIDVSQKIEDQWFEVAPSVWQEEEDELIKKGMVVSEVGDKQKAGLRDAWSKGLWEMSVDANPKATKDFHEFAVSKGMAK